MDILSLAAAAAIIFFGALSSGLTGFGFALVSVPLLIVFLPPKVVVTIVWLLGSLAELGLLATTFRHANLRRIWPLMLGGIIGTPVGSYLLLVWSASTLKLFIGVVIALAGLAMLLGFKRRVSNEKAASVPVGVASGILGGSTSMAGPPVILFFANQGIEKQTFRANLIAYFVVIALVRLPFGLAGNLLTADVLRLTAMLVPAMAAGLLLGMRLVHRVNETLFRRIALLVVIGGGIVSVVTAIRG